MSTVRGSLSIPIAVGSVITLSGSVPTLAGWALMRTTGSISWTEDPSAVASLNGSFGILMTPADARMPFVFGGVLKNFNALGITAGVLNIIFYEGGTISL